MVTLLLSLQKEDGFLFQPKSSAWAATILYTLGTRLPAQPLSLPSARCHRGQLVKRPGFKSQSGIRAAACPGLKGKQEEKAQEMGPHLGLGHRRSFPLHPPCPHPLSPDHSLFNKWLSAPLGGLNPPGPQLPHCDRDSQAFRGFHTWPVSGFPEGGSNRFLRPYPSLPRRKSVFLQTSWGDPDFNLSEFGILLARGSVKLRGKRRKLCPDWPLCVPRSF